MEDLRLEKRIEEKVKQMLKDPLTIKFSSSYYWFFNK